LISNFIKSHVTCVRFHFFIKNQNQLFFYLYFCSFFYWLLITFLSFCLYKVFFYTNFGWRELWKSPSMTKFHGFFCNVRQIFCSLHIFLIKKYFSVISSVFDKTWQEKKSKNINRTLLHLETSKFGLNVENREKM
jgi:hypothetical protein